MSLPIGDETKMEHLLFDDQDQDLPALERYMFWKNKRDRVFDELRDIVASCSRREARAYAHALNPAVKHNFESLHEIKVTKGPPTFPVELIINIPRTIPPYHEENAIKAFLQSSQIPHRQVTTFWRESDTSKMKTFIKMCKAHFELIDVVFETVKRLDKQVDKLSLLVNSNESR
jgi:hypothetical protein